MDGQSLADLVAKLAPGGVLTLVPGAIPNAPRLDGMLAQAFSGKLVATLTSAQPGATDVSYAESSLSTAGYAFLSAPATVTATLVFSTGSDGAIDLAVTATMPPSWTFGQSFPAVAALPNSTVNGLVVSAATIASPSAAFVAAKPLASTLTVTVDVAASTIASTGFLFGDSCVIGGPASFVADADGAAQPQFDLTSDTIKGVSVSGFALELCLEVACQYVAASALNPAAGLQTEVGVTTDLVAGNLTVPITVLLTGANETRYPLRLDLTAAPLALASFDDLTGFTFGASPATVLNGAGTPMKALTIDYLFATVDTGQSDPKAGAVRPAAIGDLEFQIGLGTDWSVVDGLFDLEKLFARVIVPTVWGGASSGPPGGGVSLMAGADFTVGTGALEATITYPDVALALDLRQGSSIDLDSFIKKFAKAIALPGAPDATMAITDLSVVADIGNSNYALSAGVTGSLALLPHFTLTELDLGIAYGQGAVQSFHFGAQATIAKAPLVVGVAYAGGSGGWTLAGGTDPGQQVNLSDVAADIATIFGVTLPSDLPEILLTQLDLTYNTATGAFGFDCAIGYFTGGDPILKAVTGAVTITYEGTATKTWSGKVQGSITLGSGQNLNLLAATLDFGTATVLTLQWKAAGSETIGIADLCGLVGITPPAIPPDLDLALVEVDGSYDITHTVLTLSAKARSWGGTDAAVAIWKDSAGSWQVYFGLESGMVISLSQLPLVGSTIAKFGSVALDGVTGMASVPALTAAAAGALPATITGLTPPPPAGGLPSGVALSMAFDVNGKKTPIVIGTGSPTPTPTPTPGASIMAAPVGPAAPTRPLAAAPATGGDGTKWFAVQQSIGPVSISKVGIRYDSDDSKLWALMNASLSLGGFEVGLMGLGAGSPLSSFRPSFTVSGITVSMQEGEVGFSGALVGHIDPVNLYGEIALEMGPIALGALAGYATYDGDPSFFLYAVLDAPLGGPAFCFVTGIAAGFGFNRQLLVPDVSGVASFPLVQWATGIGAPSSSPGGDMGSQVLATMTQLEQAGTIAPKIGEYWFAAGLRFTSFELLDTFALLTLSFGKDFELDLLGLSSLSLPPAPAVPIAFAQLALKASWVPSQGVLSVAGQLTNASYVLDKACHLTGGFAFYLWYETGEFVVTLGGYSPRFQPPSYYPVVPRLGLNWQVTSNLSVTGDEYFALTSSAVMAGGGLSAVWSSGSISAWFDVQADFLLVFQPLHYYLTASIELGASFSIDLWFTTLHVSIHIGVGAEIWGPSFSGEIDVDLDIISFTIGFGDAPRGGNTTVDWNSFAAQLLPQPKAGTAATPGPMMASAMLAATPVSAPVAAAAPAQAVLQITAKTGIVQSFDGSSGLDWLVDGHSFQLAVVSAIPIKSWTFASADIVLAPDTDQPQDPDTKAAVVPSQDIGVGPAGVDAGSFTSNLALTMTTAEDSQFDAVMQVGGASKAMWQKRQFDGNGVPTDVDPLNDTVIPNALTGFALVPTVAPPDHTLPILLTNLQYTIDPAIQTLTWSTPVVQSTDAFASQTVPATIAAAGPSANRAALIAAINQSGFAVATAIDVGALADPATDYLLAAPVLRYLGEARGTN